MEDEAKAIQPADEPAEAVERENLFRPLIPEAQKVLRHCMHFGTKNDQFKASIAQDILDRAGETKKRDESAPVTVINISDSDVALLAGVAKEALEGDTK